MTQEYIAKLKPIAVERLRSWIVSCKTEEQLDVCRLFVQDTIYTRYDDDYLADYLQYIITDKKNALKSEFEAIEESSCS